MYKILLACLIVVNSVVFCNCSNAIDPDDTTEVQPDKYAVSISESINGVEKTKMSACQNAIEKELVDNGYHVVHNKFINNLEQTKLFDELSGEEVGTGETESIPPMAKKRINADVLIIGEADVTDLSEEPMAETSTVNLYSARANGHFKAIWVSDGQVFAAVSDMKSGADVTKAIAREKALSTLGQAIGKKVIESVPNLDENLPTSN